LWKKSSLEGVFGDDPRLQASRCLGKAAVAAIAQELAEKAGDLVSSG